MCRLAIALVAACSSSEPPKQQPPPTVDVTTLKSTEVVDATEYLATLKSRTAATIQPQVEGQIIAIYVKPGDTVDAGQPLLQIDPGRQPAALVQAEATRASRQAGLQLAEQNLERVKKLVDVSALPRQELDNATTAVAAARAEVTALGAQIAGNKVQLGYYKILSPSHGVVGDIPGRVGDTVGPQTQITTVTDNSVLEANVSVPVDRAREITTATRIDLVDDASRSAGSGTTKFVSAQVNPETQSVLVKADVDNAKGTLRTDQAVRARVVWKVGQGLRVPALAVIRVGGQSFVYVAQEQAGQQIAKQRPVKLGDLIDNTYVVVDGLKEGERIATSNIQKLHDGAPIQPKG